MSIQRLRTLLAIAESNTFADAADLVSLTPAAVSQQMKLLEGALGVTLFDRARRPPELNPLGRELVPKVRDIVRAYDTLVVSVTSEFMVGEEFAIGAVPTTMMGLMPQTMKSLRASYSNLHIRIHPGLSGELYPQVDRGFVDAAIITEPVNVYSHLRWQPFVDEPLIVLAPLEAPQVAPEHLLETFPFIRFSRRAWVGQHIDEWLRRKNLRIHECMELDTLEAISAMVFNNLGVSIVPHRCVPSPRPFSLRRVPLGPSAKPRRLGVLSRRDSRKSRLVDILLAQLIHAVDMAGEMKALRV
jgi:DNA-binding transcriptional LysR family regulator